jgi:hypothetical protein
MEQQPRTEAQAAPAQGSFQEDDFQEVSPSVLSTEVDEESVHADAPTSDDALTLETPAVMAGASIAKALELDARKLATLLDAEPEETPGALMRSLKRFPLPPEFDEELEDMLDELHCPLPLLHPSPVHRSEKNHHYQYCYEPYSAHAQWIAHEKESCRTGSSSKQRRILMGKPLNPLPAVLVSSSSRQRLVGAAWSSAHRQRAGSHELGDSSERRCPLCAQVRHHSEYGSGTKARYCRDCEKLRWLGRKRGLKVESLRAALERYGHLNLSPLELVEHAASDFPASPSLGASGDHTATAASGDDAPHEFSREPTMEVDNFKSDGMPENNGAEPRGGSGSEDPELERIAALLEGRATAHLTPPVCSFGASSSHTCTQ